MTCTVKELLDFYGIEVDAPQYMLDSEIPVNSDGCGKYHKETRDGKEIHVFTGQGKMPEDEYETKVEYILDLVDGRWTEIRETVGSDERPSFNSRSFIDPDDKDRVYINANS